MKRIFSLVLIFVFLATAFTACNDSGTATTATDKDAKPAFDLAAAKTAIDARNVEFGGFVSKMDSVGLAGLYTSDGTLMGPNMPAAKGKAAIQSTFGGMFAAMGPIGITLTAGEVSGTEDMVNEVGVYSMTDKDGKEIDKGKYIVLWKMEDGKWKLHRDIWNSDMPPPPPPVK
jgi:ketosteroid isomerase-like protein